MKRLEVSIWVLTKQITKARVPDPCANTELLVGCKPLAENPRGIAATAAAVISIPVLEQELMA